MRLGLPGAIAGVVVDTSHFRGNYPSHCALEACASDGNADVEQLNGARWTEILPHSPLQGNARNKFAITHTERVTHLRLRIYPDGGVARLRVYGVVLPDWDELRRRNCEIDLAAARNGGLVLSASDMFFGHRHNLIMPGRAAEMSDGWETRRRRGPGHDWCIIKLGATGTIQRVEVDTWRFKGNYPESCSLEVCCAGDEADITALDWRELLPAQKLQAHTRHLFQDALADCGPVTHVRFNIYPDGGVSRLRLYGKIA